MFASERTNGTITNLLRKTCRAAVIAAAVGGAGLLAGAGPRDGWRDGRGGHGHGGVQGRVVISFPGPVVVREHVRREVIPDNLQFVAYRAGRTIVIEARGCNRSAGFVTSLGVKDADCGVLVLRNSSSGDQCAAQVLSHFELTGSFRANPGVNTVKVRVAGAEYCVPVKCAVELDDC